MRTIVSGNLTVYAFDERVYLQARNILRVKVSDASTRISLWQGHHTNTIATYTLDANKEAVVDVTDLLRLDARGRSVGDNLQGIGIKTERAEWVTVTAVFGGLIDPAHLLTPQNETINALRDCFNDEEAGGGDNMRIIPPHRMLRSISTDLWLAFEFGKVDESVARDAQFMIVARTDDGRYDCDMDGSVSMPPTTKRLVLETTLTPYYDVELQALQCDKRYAAVRWVSATGNERLHTFEVRDVENSVGEVVNLSTLDGSYNPLKGREDGFTLYLDELSAFDMWYYSDLVTSSRVEVSFDGVEWQQVEVQPKSVQIPNSDAGEANKLEIPVKWRQYDAFTL